MSDEREDPAARHEPSRPRAKGGRPGRGTQRAHPDRPCRNCGDPTPGEYCPTCGQRKVDVQVSVRTLAMELLEDQFILDRRLPRTLGALLFRPGHLTVEHVNGRIVRYIHPFRLYLVSSVIFFLLLSFFSLQMVRRAMDQSNRVRPVAEAAPADVLAQRVARLDSALATLDRSAADTSVPEPVRRALGANRVIIEGQRDAAAQQLATLEADAVADTVADAEVGGGAAGEAGGGAAGGAVDTAGTSPAQGPGPRSDDEQTLDERFGLDGERPDITVGIAAVDSTIAAQIDRLAGMTPREAAEAVAGAFFNYVPTLMFLLLPVFAGVLKLLYIRRRRYYAEHVVFLLHVHSMVFILAAVLLLLRRFMVGWLYTLIMGWVVIYIYLAMKRVYGQGWLKTFAKYWTLGWMYFWILTATIPLAFIMALLLF